jgi:hypothetical protein
MTMTNKIRFGIAYLAVACAASADAQPATVVTTDRANAFVVAAEQAYVGHLQAERAGDASLYKRFRAKEAVNEMLEDLRKQGKSEKELGPSLQRSSRYSTPLDGFRFLSAESSQSLSRLLYRRDRLENGNDRVEFLGYLVRQEGGLWLTAWLTPSDRNLLFLREESLKKGPWTK